MPSAKGSCVCGEYTFEYTGDTFDVTVCNCIPCRKYYNDHSVNLIADKDSFHQITGSEKLATRKGESGKDVTNHCCEQCLAVVYTVADAMLPKIIIKAGMFDEDVVRDKIKPAIEIYTRDRFKNFAPVPGVDHIEDAPPS